VANVLIARFISVVAILLKKKAAHTLDLDGQSVEVALERVG